MKCWVWFLINYIYKQEGSQLRYVHDTMYGTKVPHAIPYSKLSGEPFIHMNTFKWIWFAKLASIHTTSHMGAHASSYRKAKFVFQMLWIFAKSPHFVLISFPKGKTWPIRVENEIAYSTLISPIFPSGNDMRMK